MIQNQRNVAEDRRLLAKRVVKLDVLRGVREVVLTADHMRELHFDVVHDIHKMKNKRSIRTPNRHVGVRRRIRHIELDPPTHHVLHHHRLARRAKTNRPAVLIHMSTSLQAGQVFCVNVRTLALPVRTEIPALVRTLIPIQTQPFQPVVDDLMSLRRVAFLIRVLDPENQFPAMAPRVEPVEKSRARPSHMKKASR